LSHIKIIEEIEIHIASIFFMNTASISFLIGPAFLFLYNEINQSEI
jgi:hypothetical protein